MQEDITERIIKRVVPASMMDAKTRIYVNPTGRFVIGGPQGDSGLTGRKIIVDTYGGAPARGRRLLGKDPTKVDRSASYMARYIAKNCVARVSATACRCSWRTPSAWPIRFRS